jgi:pyrroline-5-carboxylate reductase
MKTHALIIGIIGLGKLGAAIASGLAKNGKFAVVGSTKTLASKARAESGLGISCFADNRELVAAADVIICAAPSKDTLLVIGDIADNLRGKVLISVAAGIPLTALRQAAGADCTVVRGMTNTQARTGDGVSIICGDVSHPVVSEVMSALGDVIELNEQCFDVGMIVSACGPAFIYLFVEAFSDAAVRFGLPRAASHQLSALTFRGAAAAMIKRAEHPTFLKDEVATPGGVTIEGLVALEKHGFRTAVAEAFAAIMLKLKR